MTASWTRFEKRCALVLECLCARATHKTKREIEELAAELAPKPDVPPTIRKRPQRKAEPEPPKSSTELCPDTVRQNARATRPAPPAVAPEKPATVEPLSPARYKVAFTASEELRDKLKRLEALMPGNDLASIVEAAVTEKIERLEAKRFGKTNRPRKSLEDAVTSPGGRGISAPVKRAVWERDGGHCTFSTPDGRRCPERHRLEFHHEEPYALGGHRSADNIRLACRAHNVYMAELDCGKEKMDQYRRSADRVREPSPTLQLRPEYAVTSSITRGRRARVRQHVRGTCLADWQNRRLGWKESGSYARVLSTWADRYGESGNGRVRLPQPTFRTR